MFLSAVKETDEDLNSKRLALEDHPLPAVPLHQLVPLEKGKKRKQQNEGAEEPGNESVPHVSFAANSNQDRVKTRHMMLALNVSLNKLLGFRWSDCQPVEPLRPLNVGEVQVEHTSPTGKKMIYYHDPESGHSVWQSCGTECFSKHMRLSSIMDEGSSSYSLMAALAEHLAVLPLRDSCHKMARVQDMAFSSCPQLVEFKREIFLCLKLDRAPYSTSRFGRRLKEAAGDYIENMNSLEDPLLQPLSHGIAKDLGVCPDDFDTIQRSISGFANKEGRGMSNDYSLGRWDSFFDGGYRLIRHIVGNMLIVNTVKCLEVGEDTSII